MFHRSAYSASKHALQAFCDSMRPEIARHNVHVTVVSPGYVQTSLSINAVTGSGQKYGGECLFSCLVHFQSNPLCGKIFDSGESPCLHIHIIVTLHSTCKALELMLSCFLFSDGRDNCWRVSTRIHC